MKICYQIYLKGLFLVLFLNTSYAQTPAPPNGKTWERVEKLSDEFNGSILDQNKWDDYHPHWSGRPPSRFKKGNAFVEGGYLKLRSTLLKNPNAVNNPLSDIWVNSAACVSKGWDAKPGYYYEARFKASSLSMTSSFWFRVGKFSEIDVIEHIGNPSRENRQDDLPYQYHANTHYYGPHQGKPNKAAEWRMPSRGRDGFHTYGFWWKSPTELLFYYDGREVMKIVPRVPLNENLKMIFDTEVFPFAQAGVPNIGLPKVENLNNNAKNTMLVDWVRTYKLVDGNSNGENTPPSVSFSNIQNNAQFPVGYSLKPEVNASDNDGIANVRLYMNDEFVRQENARPYQWGVRDDIDGVLKNLKQGKYILKAIAKDKRGAETIKSITVNIGSNGNGNTQLITNGVYFITSNQSNQRLLSRAQENFSAIMHDPLNFNDQRWEFKHLGDNIYTIQNFGNKRFLEVPNATCFNGSNVATWANEIGNHKKWKIISNGSGLYAIKPLHCQARGLDRKNGAKNTNIQIWDFGIDNANQKWKIIRDQNRSFPEESQVIDAEGIILYPNPAKDIVFLSGLRVEDLIKIYNIQGKVVFTTKAKSEDEVISMAKFETGIYIIKINGNQIHKLIKE